MKRIVVSIVLVLIFGSCSIPEPNHSSSASSASATPSSVSSSSSSVITTTLTIKNNTTVDLELINWSDDSGNKYYFGTDQVYDLVLSQWVSGMKSGNAVTKSVNSGTGYIYFYFTTSYKKYKTSSIVTVNTGDNITFVLTGTTIVSPASINSINIEEKNSDWINSKE